MATVGPDLYMEQVFDALQRVERQHIPSIDGGARAVQLQPGLAGLHNNHGTVLKVAGRFAEARASFTRAAELDPSQPLVAYSVGATIVEGSHLDPETMHALDARHGDRFRGVFFVPVHASVDEVFHHPRRIER